MRRVLSYLLLLIFLAGCTLGRTPAERVQLNALEPLPPSQAVEADDQGKLRMAVASMIAPEKAVGVYMELARYLEVELGRPVELVQRRTYAETYDLLRSGTVDFAAVCTNVYVMGSKEFGLELLASPEVDGQATYRALIIAKSQSGIETFDDLRGKRFAFTDPLSTSGRIYPVSLLRERATTPEAYFSSSVFTYSHDNSILAVVDGVVDGAAVDSLVYDQWAASHPNQAGQLTVLQESTEFGSPPFVVAPHVADELHSRLQGALLNLDQRPEGLEILEGLGADRLVALPDSAYDAVRALAEEVGEAP